MLDVRQLAYFVAVAEELHFARASDRLGVAQSAVSAKIQRLESQLKVRLLDRGKRKPVTLTDAGALFYAEAVVTLRHLQRAEQVGLLASRGLTGVVRLGYVASAVTSGLLSQSLKAFRTSHPEVRMDVIAMETPRQLEALDNGEIDVGFGRPRRLYPAGVEGSIVHSERLLVVLPENHPLAAKRSLKAADLRGQSFVTPQFNENEGFAETLSRLGEAGGFSVGSEFRVNDFITAVSLAAADYGVVLAPESIQRFEQPGVTFRRIRDFSEQVHLALARRQREPSRAVSAFVKSALGTARK
jgi:DNA-binding transcriptional LysR family regulator